MKPVVFSSLFWSPTPFYSFFSLKEWICFMQHLSIKLADRDLDHPGMLITHEISHYSEKIVIIISTSSQLPLCTHRLKRSSCCFSCYSFYSLFFSLNIALCLKKP